MRAAFPKVDESQSVNLTVQRGRALVKASDEVSGLSLFVSATLLAFAMVTTWAFDHTKRPDHRVYVCPGGRRFLWSGRLSRWSAVQLVRR
jgi:hypothetical protein